MRSPSSGSGSSPTTRVRDPWWLRGRRRVYVALLRASIGRVRLARALDLGPGCGSFSEALSKVSERVHHAGCDRREIARAIRHGRAPGVGVDARRLPFRARSFDLVTLFHALEGAPDQARVLREARRVLRPGGLIALSVTAHDGLDPRRRLRRYSRAKLRRALSEAGLQVERVTHANAALLPVLGPTMLVLRCLRALRLLSRRAQPGESLPRWLSALLYRVFAAELALSSRFDLPFGHSIFALARRPTAERVRQRRAPPASPAEPPGAPLPAPTTSPKYRS